jgi:hypothetical protein
MLGMAMQNMSPADWFGLIVGGVAVGEFAGGFLLAAAKRLFNRSPKINERPPFTFGGVVNYTPENLTMDAVERALGVRDHKRLCGLEHEVGAIRNDLTESFPTCPVCKLRRPLDKMLKATLPNGRKLVVCAFCRDEIKRDGRTAPLSQI